MIPAMAFQADPGARTRFDRFVWLAVLLVASGTVALVFSPPALEGTSLGWLAGALRAGWSPFCHQAADRSFHVAGIQLLACSRCTGIFVGALAGVLIAPAAAALARRTSWPRWLLLAGLVPMALDVALGLTGAWGGTVATRAATGAVAGIVSAVWLMPHVCEAARDISGSIHGGRYTGAALTTGRRSRPRP